MVDPSKANGNQIIFEWIFRRGKNASIKDSQVRLWRRCGDGTHDQSEVLLRTTSVKNLDDVIAGPGRERTRCNTDAFDVVDRVRGPSGGGEALCKIIAEPFGTVGPDQDQIEVVDQSGLAL